MSINRIKFTITSHCTHHPNRIKDDHDNRLGKITWVSKVAWVTASEWRIMERDGYSGTFEVPANSLLPHRFPDMTCHCNIWCAGDSRKEYRGLIDIIRDEIVWQRKMLVHRPDDGGHCVLCPGAVWPFTLSVRLTNRNGNHQYFTLKRNSIHWNKLFEFL